MSGSVRGWRGDSVAEKSLPGSRVFPCRPRAPPRAGPFGGGEGREGAWPSSERQRSLGRAQTKQRLRVSAM
ncbi:hypothetical protein CSC36_6370 [Pseudomonas aeruginosa]|nr:hypothetical protein CSC36_6370 [Pseudomonas aeruginosa]